MQKRSEGQFNGTKSANLYYQNWQTEDAVATLVMTHGMAEHSDAYQLLAKGLSKYKINVSAWDLRGHGKSDGKRGYVDKFTDYVDDLGLFLKRLADQKKLDIPYFLGGHSMGALILLRYILENGAGKAKGLCMSSPLLGLSLEVPPVKDYASHILNRFLPTMTLNNEIDFNDLTHDEAVIKSYTSDPFRHDKISSGVYLGMVENFKIVGDRAGNAVSIPTLMQLAGDDRIVSRAASEAFFKTIYTKDKKLIVYEKDFHEIYNEVDREKVYEDLSQFILKSIGSAQ